jgi:dipeptidyl aminopeptidase/acylaminoacyl peptidase
MLEMEYEMVGDPVKDKELLEEISPIFHIGKIKIPLLIAHGANDPRVSKAESDQIVEAVRKTGSEVIYLVKEDEGHGFRNEENRLEFYRVVEGFLRKYLELR